MRTLKNRWMAELEKIPFAPGASNPHLHTVYGTVFRRPPPADLQLEQWPTPDGDRLRVHVGRSPSDRPIALLLHGLEGSARSPYIVGQARHLAARGYRPVVMEHRSCGGTMNQARRLYHSGETTDLDFVVRQLIQRWPGRPLFVYGVSLGGNQVAKWLGTHTIPDAVRAAVVVSPPFDLTVSGAHMDAKGWFYVRYFLRSLIPKALAKERQYPGSMDPVAVRTARTFEAFDTHATAALHGFADAQDYYRKSGCGQFLDQVRTPLLIVASEDDPFNPASTIPYRVVRESDYVLGLFPHRGGHVGFIGQSLLRPCYWLEDVTTTFFECVRREG
jgi:hypothetical protein